MYIKGFIHMDALGAYTHSVIYQLSDIGIDDQIPESEIWSIIYWTHCFVPNIIITWWLCYSFLGIWVRALWLYVVIYHSTLRSVTIYIENSHVVRLRSVRRLRALNHHAHLSSNTCRNVPSQQWLSVTTNIHKYTLHMEKSS